MHIQEEFQNSPAIVTELKCPLFNSPNIMDLCNRINCWRLDVDACTPCGSPPTTFQSRGSMSGLSSSSSTRVRGNARSRPYSSHPRRPQSVYVIGFTSEFDNRHGPTRTMQHHERPSVPLPEHPLARVPECGNSSRVSLRTPSIREVPTTGHGLDLPHPEWNPLVCLPSLPKILLSEVPTNSKPWFLDHSPSRNCQGGVLPDIRSVQTTQRRTEKDRISIGSMSFSFKRSETTPHGHWDCDTARRRCRAVYR